MKSLLQLVIHKMDTNAEFETNIHSAIVNTEDAGAFRPDFESFIEQRIRVVKKELGIKEKRN
jgi:hypothetical protein